MSANTKRVFYVKDLAHSIFAELLGARADIELDRLGLPAVNPHAHLALECEWSPGGEDPELALARAARGRVAGLRRRGWGSRSRLCSTPLLCVFFRSWNQQLTTRHGSPS